MSTQTKTPNPKDEVLKNLMHLNNLQSEQIQNLERSRNLEMECKNKAYFFILENGYIDEFRAYSNKNRVK